MEEGILFLRILGGSSVRFLFWTRRIYEGRNKDFLDTFFSIC